MRETIGGGTGEDCKKTQIRTTTMKTFWFGIRERKKWRKRERSLQKNAVTQTVRVHDVIYFEKFNFSTDPHFVHIIRRNCQLLDKIIDRQKHSSMFC